MELDGLSGIQYGEMFTRDESAEPRQTLGDGFETSEQLRRAEFICLAVVFSSYTTDSTYFICDVSTHLPLISSLETWLVFGH